MSFMDHLYVRLYKKPQPKPISKATPCRVCGKMDFLPFVCPYCGNMYCNDHRVPEQHACDHRVRKPLTRFDRYWECVVASLGRRRDPSLSEYEVKVRFYSVPRTMEHISADHAAQPRPMKESEEKEGKGFMAWIKKHFGHGSGFKR